MNFPKIFRSFFRWLGPPGEMRSTKNCLWDLKHSAKYNSRNFNTEFFNFFSFFWNFFSTDENHLGWLQNDNHWNSSATPRLTSIINHAYQKRQKIRNLPKCVLMGTQRGGGGHLGVTVFASNVGGGEHKKIFRKVESFWFFPPLLPKRQKLSTFWKKNSCPPPRCEHSNTQMSPPRLVPSKTPYY